MTENPYNVLGVAEDATADEIKSAYRKKAKQYHPDLHPDDPNAQDKMNRINEAYDILSDPEKLRMYKAGAYDNPYGNPFEGPYQSSYQNFYQNNYQNTYYGYYQDPKADKNSDQYYQNTYSGYSDDEDDRRYGYYSETGNYSGRNRNTNKNKYQKAYDTFNFFYTPGTFNVFGTLLRILFLSYLARFFIRLVLVFSRLFRL